MALDSNATSVPIHHLSKGTAKLAHRLLDGGPSMLERALIVVGMDWMRFHVVPCMIFCPILRALLLGSIYRIHACGQPNFPQENIMLACRTSCLWYLFFLFTSGRCLPNIICRRVDIPQVIMHRLLTVIDHLCHDSLL